jgi:hypothetical protein
MERPVTTGGVKTGIDSPHTNARPWAKPRMGIQEGPIPNGAIRTAQRAASNHVRPSPGRREGDPRQGKCPYLLIYARLSFLQGQVLAGDRAIARTCPA